MFFHAAKSRIMKTRVIIALILALTFCQVPFSPPAEAGLFSSLSKVASKAGKAGSAGKVAGAGKAVVSVGAMSKLKTVGTAAVLMEAAPGGGFRFVDELGQAMDATPLSKVAKDTPTVKAPRPEVFDEVDKLMENFPDLKKASADRARVKDELAAAIKASPDQAPFLKMAHEFKIPKGKPIEVFADVDVLTSGHPDVLRIAKQGQLFVFGKNSTKLPVQVLKGDKLAVEFAPGVKVVAKDSKLFDEAATHLNRLPNLANARHIALSNDAKMTDLPQVAFRQDGVPVVGGMSPDTIETSFSIIRGQSAILSGKVEDGYLLYKTGLTKTGRVSLDRLRKAASDANVDLTILDSGAKQAKVGSLSKMSGKLASAKTNADVFAAITPKGQEMVIEAAQDVRGRVQISATATKPVLVNSLEGAHRVAETTTSLTADIADYLLMRSVVQGVKAVYVYTNDEDRTRELNSRLIPGVNSWIPIIAIANLFLGLISSIAGWRFWRRVWPMPQSWVMKIVRAIAYVVPYLLLFGTIQMVVSYIWHAIQLIWWIIAIPIWILKKLFGLGRGQAA